MKIQYLVILFFFSFSLDAWTCSTKVDPNKVVFFVDTNYSDLEIKTAEKAACQRGERLVVVPKNYSDYTSHLVQYEKSKKAFDKCMQKQGDCGELGSKAYADHSTLTEFKNQQPSLEEQIRDQFKELKSKNAKIQNVTISGHDGGGWFGGHKGDFYRQSLADLMKEFPEINDVQSLMLLGCYTGVQQEILNWKSIFPNVRMIGGYDGSAPLSDKLAGHTYLEDLLSKEKKLLQQADEKKINNFVANNIRNFNMLSAAVYVSPVCEEESPEDDKEFYYSSKERSLKFQEFDASKCLSMKNELFSMSDIYLKYDSGELEPPQDPSSGELRNLYDRARAVEHCFENQNVNLNVSNLFNLRFYSAVKENFARFYKDDLEEAERILNTITPDSMAKNLQSQIELLTPSLEEAQNQLDYFEKDPKSYLKQSEKKVAELESKFNELIKKPEFKAIWDKYDFSQTNYFDLLSKPANERQIILKILSEQVPLSMAKSGHQQLVQAPDTVKHVLKLTVDFQQSHIDMLKNKIEAIKAPESTPKVWVPTQNNLNSKSRKETLSNLHQMFQLESINALDEKQAATVSWLRLTTSQHLQYFQNPFSWHEVTSRTEAPEIAVDSLQTAIDRRAAMMNAGYGIGYGYGGSVTGGGFGQ